MADRIEIEIDGVGASALLGIASAAAAGPAVLVAHHREGLSRFTADIIDRLVALGFSALSIDNYHGMPSDADPATWHGLINDRQLTRDLEVGIRFLSDHPQIDPRRLAVLGHCMGGRTALLGASLFPVFRAAVIFYSGGVFRNRNSIGPTPGDRLKGVHCPVIGFFGLRDHLIPNAEVDRIEEALTAVGTACEFIRYADAGHAFANYDSPSDYREAAATDSWSRTTAFLRRTLDRDRQSL
jgi:carboxymethylenebutenolidase